MSRRRAKPGGEVGMNGEFYPAGAFLPATALPKRGASRRHSGPKRALIAPGELAEVPDGMLSLFARIRLFVAPRADGTVEIEGRFLVPDHPAIPVHFTDLAELQALVDRYNHGERLIAVA